MKITDVQPLGFYDQSAVTFEVDSVPATHQEWSEAIGELPLRELFGEAAESSPALAPHPDVGYSMERRADGSQSRDWWAGDHLLHVDGTRWDVQPVYTVIACKEAAPDSPGTLLLDTAKLYEQAMADGFWEKQGIDPQEFSTMRSVFVDSTYYTEALPYMQALANKEDAAAIKARIEADLKKSESVDLWDHAAKIELAHPPKAFPFVRSTPLRGLPSFFVDGGGRNSTIRGGNWSTNYRGALHAFRETYLAGEAPFKQDLIKRIGWAANRCVIFPQVGSLHAAEAGNDKDRLLHLGFLVDARDLQVN